MGGRMRMLAGAGLAAVLAVAVAGTGAQGAEGPPEDFRISGPGAIADEGDPALAWDDTANRYFVVYEDERDQATRGTDTYGQRVAG